MLYCVKASQAAELMALKRADDGGWLLVAVPDTVENNAVTVLEYTGVGLFAEVPRIDEKWPRVAESSNAVVVLGVRTLPDVPSSKVIKSMRRWAEELRANGGRLIIAGVSPATAKVLQAGGLVDLLGPDGVVPESDRLFAATEEAVARGHRWIEANRDTRSAD